MVSKTVRNWCVSAMVVPTAVIAVLVSAREGWQYPISSVAFVVIVFWATMFAFLDEEFTKPRAFGHLVAWVIVVWVYQTETGDQVLRTLALCVFTGAVGLLAASGTISVIVYGLGSLGDRLKG